MVKEHLTLRWAHSVQRRGARWVDRTLSEFIKTCGVEVAVVMMLVVVVVVVEDGRGSPCEGRVW